MVESRPFANVTRVKNGHDDKPFITLYDEKQGAGASPDNQISS
ncbi:hypothetical protein HMPREF3036_01583 [Sutterella sp. KLE1602]|nr:hypothetical protein HMPREF3036_01583 [Sutterella sp. KLE1602]